MDQNITVSKTVITIAKCFCMAAMLFVLIFTESSYAQKWSFAEPKSYDECILKNVKEGMGERAVSAIMLSCRNMFPYVEDHKSKECLIIWNGTTTIRVKSFPGDYRNGYQRYRISNFDVVVGEILVPKGAEEGDRLEEFMYNEVMTMCK